MRRGVRIVLGAVVLAFLPTVASAGTEIDSAPIRLVGTYRADQLETTPESPPRESVVIEGETIALPAAVVVGEVRGGDPIAVTGHIHGVAPARYFSDATVEIVPHVYAAATTGDHKVLVITVNRATPVPKTQMDVVMADANGFFLDSSYGQTTITGTVLPTSVTVTAPSPFPCADTGIFATDLAQYAQLDQYHAAAQLAAQTANPGLVTASFDHVVVVSPDLTQCSWAGLANLGGRNIWIDVLAFDDRVVPHELGHNFGLSHANVLDCQVGGVPVTFAPIAASCVRGEYGNWFDAMGAGYEGTGLFSIGEKFRLGWLDQTRLRTVAGTATVDLSPMEGQTPGFIQGATAVTAAGDRVFVEYRTPTGRDSFINSLPSGWASPLAGEGVHLHFLANSPSLRGVFLLDGKPTTLGSTVGTFDGPDDWVDAPLVVGTAYSSPSLPGVSVTVESISGGIARVQMAGFALPPTAPTNPAATSGDGTATVSFAPPANDFGAPVTTYAATAVPIGTGTTVTGTAATSPIELTGMRNGATYSVTVRATNAGGTGPTSGAVVASPVAVSGTLVPITPQRLLNTRGGPAMASDTIRSVNLLALAANDTRAMRSVALNITATEATGAGFLSVYPCAAGVPPTSTVNFEIGQTVANAATIDVDPSGNVCVKAYAGTGTVHAIVDVTGTYSGPSGATAARYHPLAAPDRLIDTRGGAKLDSNIRAVKVTEVSGVPATATAVTLNVTAVEPNAPGYLTVFPCGVNIPDTSTLNYIVNDIVPNSATVGVGTGGSVCLSSYAPTHFLVDITGYFEPVVAGATFTGVAPDRLIDTRKTVKLAANGVLEVQVTGRSGVPNEAGAVVVNVTAVETDAPGYLTVFPCGQAVPKTSSVNYKAKQIVANNVTVGVGGGKVCVYSYAPTNVIVDVTGYYV
jgi:hypothetical protein